MEYFPLANPCGSICNMATRETMTAEEPIRCRVFCRKGFPSAHFSAWAAQLRPLFSGLSRQESFTINRRAVTHLPLKGASLSIEPGEYVCYPLWTVREANERILGIFDNGSIRRILHVRRGDCVPSVELRRNLCLTSIPALLTQSRFGQAERHPDSELITNLLLSTPRRTWRRRTGGQ